MALYSCEVCEGQFTGFPGNANRFCSRACYWESKKHKETRQCPVCKGFYQAVPSKRADYCSRECFYKDVGKWTIDAPCKTCGKIVRRWKTRVHPSGNIYCSKECSGIAQRKPGWKESPLFRLHANISKMVRKTLLGTKNYRCWQELLGYSASDLKKHIEKQFKPGMSWDNYGLRGWHIDHIIPRSAFNFRSSQDSDFHRCWALKNLQPMWAKENIRKGKKLERPFQPSLSFKWGSNNHEQGGYREVL